MRALVLLPLLLVACSAGPEPRRATPASPAPVNSSIFLDVAVGPDFERDPAPVLASLTTWLTREGVVLNGSRYRR